jgi:hypothetical protein
VLGRGAGFEVVGRAEDLAGLLERVFDFAGREEGGGCGVRGGVFGVAMDEAEFVVVDYGGVEGADGTVRTGWLVQHDEDGKTASNKGD